MRILVISTLYGYKWGGSEELWYNTVLRALEENHEIHITFFKKNGTHSKIKDLIKKGVVVHFTNDEVYINEPLLKKIFYKIINKKIQPKTINRFAWIDLLKPDKILVNASTAINLIHYDDLTAWMLQTRLRFSVLIHHHFENGILSVSNKKSLCLVLSRAQNIFIVALRNLQVLERQLSLILPNVKLVQNPINVSYPHIISWPESDILQIAIVARLDCSCKGQDILIHSLSDLSMTGIHFNVNLYGNGPDEDYIKTLIKFYQLEGRVFLKGFRYDLTSIWKENHILMLPSISEGTPISLVEAMSCGRPAIVTDVGDNARLVNDNINGFVTDVCSVNSLNKVLRRALNKSVEWESMGIKAFEVFNEFNLQDPAKHFLDLLITD